MDVDGMSLRAVIFDVDGTLAETERYGHRIAYNRAFDELGADWQWGEGLYGDLLEIEGGAERLGHYLEAHRPGFTPADGQQAFVDRTHARKNHHYQEMLRAGDIPVRTGIRRLIDEIRAQGLSLAIASSSRRSNVVALLRNVLADDAETWFRVIVTGDEVSRKKPHTEVYERVLAELDLPAAACIAIEDSENGCRAAVRAGLPTIVTTSSYTGHHPFDGAMLVADSLGEPDRPWRVRRSPPGIDSAPCLDGELLLRLHRHALDSAA